MPWKPWLLVHFGHLKQYQSTADLIWPWKEPVDGTAIDQCREHSHSYPGHRMTWHCLGGNYLGGNYLGGNYLDVIPALCTLWGLLLQSKIDWFLFRTPNQGISIMCGDTWLLLKTGSVNHIVKIDWTWLAYFCPLFVWKTRYDQRFCFGVLGNQSSDSIRGVFNQLQDTCVVSLFMSICILYLQITSYRIIG